MPLDMITVPACDECNGMKSRHDDFLRDLLVTDFQGSKNPIAQRIFHDKTIRSHRKGKSLFGRITSDDMVHVPVFDEHGNRDSAVVGSFDPDRANEMISMMVRGLYYSFRSLIFPADCKFRIGRLVAKEDLDAWIDLFDKNGANVHRIGENVFSCAHNYGARDEFVTLWLLEFYDRVQYSVMTTPAAFEPRPK